MEKDSTFSYRYSAAENSEVKEIRKKYLPPEENKLDALKRLDHIVQTAGHLPSLCVGIIGCLLFGVGLCFALEVIGKSMLVGIPFGIIGVACMIVAYPVFRSVSRKVKAEYTPRILKLTEELMANS